MAKKREKLFSKIVVILFLLMIVLGFTIPGFMNAEEPTQQYVEPRVCQNDADCYLMCDTPVVALCTQNLCQQNVCGEYNLFPFQQDPITFTLKINVNGSVIDLGEKSNSKDMFVKFSEQEVQVFTSGLSLNQILEKVEMNFNGNCLVMGNDNYCSNDENELIFVINDDEGYNYGDYAPVEGDVVELSYSLTP